MFITALTAAIVKTYLSKNAVSQAALPGLILTVNSKLRELDKKGSEDSEVVPEYASWIDSE